MHYLSCKLCIIIIHFANLKKLTFTRFCLGFNLVHIFVFIELCFLFCSCTSTHSSVLQYSFLIYFFFNLSHYLDIGQSSSSHLPFQFTFFFCFFLFFSVLDRCSFSLFLLLLSFFFIFLVVESIAQNASEDIKNNSQVLQNLKEVCM